MCTDTEEGLEGLLARDPLPLCLAEMPGPSPVVQTGAGTVAGVGAALGSGARAEGGAGAMPVTRTGAGARTGSGAGAGAGVCVGTVAGSGPRAGSGVLTVAAGSGATGSRLLSVEQVQPLVAALWEHNTRKDTDAGKMGARGCSCTFHYILFHTGTGCKHTTLCISSLHTPRPYSVLWILVELLYYVSARV